MNRRKLLVGIVSAAAAAIGARLRLRRARPEADIFTYNAVARFQEAWNAADPVYRLDIEPESVHLGYEPATWDAVDIVRQERLAPGQKEKREYDFPGGTEYVLRTPVAGSPERAYLAQCNRVPWRGTTVHDLLLEGGLLPDDVWVSLMSAAEIDADRALHPEWYERGGAVAPFIILDPEPRPS